MNKHLKSLLIVIPISFLTAGLIILLFLLDPEFKPNFYMISSMVISTVWAFFLIPALPYAFHWAKNYYENLNFDQAFRLGYFLGRGWGVLAFLLLLIVSPVVGVMWYKQTINLAILFVKRQRYLAKIAEAESEIFDL